MDGKAEHARLAPSSADLRVSCPGSLLTSELYGIDLETEEQREGTAAHWVLLQQAHGYVVTEGELAPNDVMVTDEMIDGGQMALDELDKLLRPYPDAAMRLTFELPVDCSHIHPENWGTPDAWVYIDEDLQLFILDYKFGHRYVPADSWQLINYSAGILAKLNIDKSLYPYVTVTFVIVQPRFYHGAPSRQWSCKASELVPRFARLIEVYEEATGPNPTTVAGPWCGDCDGRFGCETLQRSAAAAVSYIGNVYAVDYDDVSLGVELMILESAAERIKARLSALTIEATARVEQGHTVYGYGTVPTFGLQRWLPSLPVDEIAEEAQILGANILKPMKLITPKQAIKAGMDPSWVNEISETPKTGVKLVRRENTLAYAAFSKQV